MSERLSAQYIAQAIGEGKEFKNGDNSWNTVCPAHNDKGPSLTVSEGEGGRLLVHCHAGCSQDAVIDRLRSLDLWPAKKREWVAQSHAPANASPPVGVKHPTLGSPVKSWEYRNPQGQLVGYYHRFERTLNGKLMKELFPMSWGRADDGKEGWCWKGFPKPRPLYRGHLLSAHPTKDVLILEGEKTCDAAQEIFGEDFICISWPGGSKAVKYANWEQLKGRRCIIWPDADVPGAKCAKTLAEILSTIGTLQTKVVDLPGNLPEGWDLADPIPEHVKLDPKLLTRVAPDFMPGSGGVLERFNKEFALVLLGDKAVILWEKPDEEKPDVVDTQFLSIAGFNARYGNEYVQVGRSEVTAPKYWMGHESRRSYDGVTFEPGRVTKRNYNLWRGFKYEPDSDGDWSILDQHIRENIAKGDESLYHWIVGWFAQIIQHPEFKPGTSIALRGPQGTGKTVLGLHMGALYPQHYVLVDDSRYVTGQFNTHMASTLLLHADEAFWAGDPRNAGRLKGMVTSKTHRIEPKGKDSFEVKNFMRLFVSSNNNWLVPAGYEERRFAVMDVGTGKMQNKPFFIAMEKQLMNGGYEGLLHSLQTWDLSTTDIGVIPQTAALMDQKHLSLESVARFWFERLRDGEIIPGRGLSWPDTVPTEDLYLAYIDRATKWGERRRVSEVHFGRELKDFMPDGELDRVRTTAKRLDNYGQQETIRAWGYRLPPLDKARASFDKALNAHTDWPEHDAIDQALADHDEVPF